MSTISKCTIGGHDFYYERVPLRINNGVAVFAVKDEADAKEFNLYWVVIPPKLDWDKILTSPKDGHVACMCKNSIDAEMIAFAIDFTFNLLKPNIGIDNAIKDALKDLNENYDTDAMEKEILRLNKEGKTDAEVIEIMKSKRETFLRKTPAPAKKDGGEW